MLYELKKIAMDQWFLVIIYVLSVVLAFLIGYVAFRYWQVENCKSEMEIGDFGQEKAAFYDGFG